MSADELHTLYVERISPTFLAILFVICLFFGSVAAADAATGGTAVESTGLSWVAIGATATLFMAAVGVTAKMFMSVIASNAATNANVASLSTEVRVLAAIIEERHCK